MRSIHLGLALPNHRYGLIARYMGRLIKQARHVHKLHASLALLFMGMAVLEGPCDWRRPRPGREPRSPPSAITELPDGSKHGERFDLGATISGIDQLVSRKKILPNIPSDRLGVLGKQGEERGAIPIRSHGAGRRRGRCPPPASGRRFRFAWFL